MDANADGAITEIQVLVDATDANTAKLIQGYATQITRAFALGNSSARPLVGAQIQALVQPRTRIEKVLWSRDVRARDLDVPALLAALAMSKEGEQKTILQVYVSSISAHEFLLGKIGAFMVIAMCRMGHLHGLALFTIFGLEFRGRSYAAHRRHILIRLLRVRVSAH